MKKRLVLAILVMGLSGIIAQILLLRELLITFYGNELSIGIILANWLILEAIGAYFSGKGIERLRRKLETFVGLTIIFSLSLPAAIYLTRIVKEIIGVTPGEGVGLVSILCSSFLILLPVSVSHGALFPFCCKLYSLYSQQENAVSISRVYIYETLGTIAGGVGLTYLLIPNFHSLMIALAVSLLNIFLCIYLLGTFRPARGALPGTPDARILTAKIPGVLSLILLLLISFFVFTGGADKLHWLSIRNQWKGQEIVHYQNSIYGNVAAVRREEQYTFFADGIPVITAPVPDITFVEEFVHLPMLSHLQPERILVISGGAGGVINEILKHPSVERIDYAELDPLILKVVRKFPTPLTEAELSDPRVNTEYLDGRLLVRTTPHKYDLVLVGLSNPSDLQVNRLFTREFFALVKKRLKQEGILVISLPGSLSYLSEELKNLNACIINTLKQAFPCVRIIPGDFNLFLASSYPGVSQVNSTELSRRLSERKLEVRLITPAHIEYKLHPRWLNWFLKSLAGGTRKINQDFQPLGLFYSLSYWNALFSPYLAGLFRWFGKITLRCLFIPLIFLTLTFLFFVSRIKRPGRVSIPLCIASTGLAGMIFELAFIFSFQALYGYAFHWIGLLVTALMVGIAAGSLRMTLLLRRIKKRELAVLLKIELAIVLFSGVLPAVFFIFRPYLGQPAAFFLQIIFLALSFFTGFLIGMQFPLANQMYLTLSPKPEASDLSRTAGLLYGADLFGGWIGGITGGVILLPVLGLLRTCMVVLMIKACSLLILAVSGPSRP